jgi:ABC-type antimicrobial peptide transport system permease subunit
VAQVLQEGLTIVAVGITAGAVVGFGLGRAASTYLEHARTLGVVPAVVAAAMLVAAALVASLIPAIRGSRVDVLQAL